VAELSPNLKRYALVPIDSSNGVRRFHLARVAVAGRAPDAQRLERMEDVAAQEHEREEGRDESCR
jgi:20S proteasome alpha/beta subunit